ncbi:ATP-binding protein [Companilactobacillus hulinensis]|uniref:ATP-binding protein n=1 Tax=Companilactobacillus hulinensis TaxID=2486007 RepID=UPI000F7A229D|nr:chromosome partitioning protein ParA [Companilactobacillus hulinensis]
MDRDILTPVSFHLRNFNNYQSLDMPASTNGNLTLIGENTAGKTTLANCFFPMLIDGSIATPSFNPAKGTKGLGKSTTRNSSNDSRTFEGMLLGWGSGSMKVRTGYSYMLMSSPSRQVIVGIGAHRAAGENKKPTWWFVAISKNTKDKLNIKTTDKSGISLEKDEFIEANENINADFEVFSNVSEFQNCVSEKVYGFVDTKNLNQLAITYRLLASPILTAGNASITPILEAMKNAQEGIDNQMIDSVAFSQREVNKKNLTFERLSRAEERLNRIKTEIFWRNLNHLNDITLEPYSKKNRELSSQESLRDNNQRKLSEQIEQLEKIHPLLEQAKMDVQNLQEKMARQRNIEDQRNIKQDMVAFLTKQLANYENLEAEYKQQQVELQNVQQELDQLNKNAENVNRQIIPLKDSVSAAAADLSSLKELIKDKETSELISSMEDYLRKTKTLITKYKNIEKSQSRLTADIEIVSEIRENMDGKIDLRVTSLMSGKVRAGLHQDNMDVHNAGAAKMNIHYTELEQKRLNLLATHSDLQSFLDRKDLLADLSDTLDKLRQLQGIMNDIQSKTVRVTDKFQFAKNAKDESGRKLQDDYQDFEVADQKKKINELQKQINELVIDNELEKKITEANNKQAQYQRSEDEFNKDKIETQTDINNLNQKIAELHLTLEELATRTESNLKTLAPYMIKGYELDKITETLKFVDQNRNQIKNHSFGDLSDKIGYNIRHSDVDGKPDRYALDAIFEERGHAMIASSMRQQRSIDKNDLRVVSFDINEAQKLISEDKEAVSKSLEQLNTGNEAAQLTYMGAATHQISEQYDLVDEYNQILAHGVRQSQGIQLKVSLHPVNVDEQVIEEARNSDLTKRPALLKEVQKRLERLANDINIAEDDDQFMEAAHQLLDIRQWS